MEFKEFKELKNLKFKEFKFIWNLNKNEIRNRGYLD